MSSDGKVERDKKKRNCNVIKCILLQKWDISQFHLQVANSDCKICSKKLLCSIKSVEILTQLPECNYLTAYFEHKI